MTGEREKLDSGSYEFALNDRVHVTVLKQPGDTDEWEIHQEYDGTIMAWPELAKNPPRPGEVNIMPNIALPEGNLLHGNIHPRIYKPEPSWHEYDGNKQLFRSILVPIAIAKIVEKSTE